MKKNCDNCGHDQDFSSIWCYNGCLAVKELFGWTPENCLGIRDEQEL